MAAQFFRSSSFVVVVVVAAAAVDVDADVGIAAELVSSPPTPPPSPAVVGMLATGGLAADDNSGRPPASSSGRSSSSESMVLPSCAESDGACCGNDDVDMVRLRVFVTVSDTHCDTTDPNSFTCSLAFVLTTLPLSPFWYDANSSSFFFSACCVDSNSFVSLRTRRSETSFKFRCSCSSVVSAIFVFTSCSDIFSELICDAALCAKTLRYCRVDSDACG
mmetsp:Transcript_26577/g.74337  ORF Transcript_26577/g.74337 Transcript_26577/m.74337 type:complete len:219 (-) Transcript_26577:958-1614(-)